jgi:NTP pyrophosphatase (non-canonical NTP hydrolase)
MKFDELTNFAKQEHKRLVEHYNAKGDPKVKYTMFAKLVEEMGELSEAILTYDKLQRFDKLTNTKAEAKKKLEDEFADVVLVSMILAQELNVDMDKALTTKIKKIKARKY